MVSGIVGFLEPAFRILMRHSAGRSLANRLGLAWRMFLHFASLPLELNKLEQVF